MCFAVFAFLLACNNRYGVDQAQPVDTQATSAEPSVGILTPGERRSFNIWLAREMYEQIYARKTDSNKQHLSWVNVLFQGGSVEGVYHGMILSTEYSALEVGRASAAAVRFFAEEAARLHSQIDNPTEIKRLSERIAKEAMKSSLFGLKRELGSQILQSISEKSSNRRALAELYADRAFRWADLGVDFGLKQRNIKDYDFHEQWAKKNSLGLIQWELLNRAHRIFNQLGEINQVGK